MGTATPEELEELLEQMAEIQDALEAGGFYLLDMKIEILHVVLELMLLV